MNFEGLRPRMKSLRVEDLLTPVVPVRTETVPKLAKKSSLARAWEIRSSLRR